MKKFLEFLKKAWSVVWHTDTLAHGGCCAAIALSVFVIFATPAWNIPIWVGVIVGVLAAMIAGLFVEACQWNFGVSYSKNEGIKDLIRDGLGCLIALIPELIYILN